MGWMAKLRFLHHSHRTSCSLYIFVCAYRMFTITNRKDSLRVMSGGQEAVIMNGAACVV